MLDKLKEALARRSDAEGATAVEYGIMVALIAIVIIGSVIFIGQELDADFSCVGEELAQNGTAGCAP